VHAQDVGALTSASTVPLSYPHVGWRQDPLRCLTSLSPPPLTTSPSHCLSLSHSLSHTHTHSPLTHLTLPLPLTASLPTTLSSLTQLNAVMLCSATGTAAARVISAVKVPGRPYINLSLKTRVEHRYHSVLFCIIQYNASLSMILYYSVPLFTSFH
jgi:hypothetical protein